MLSQFAFLDIGTPELILILVIILLLFGGRKLPELSRSIGNSIRELRKGFESTDDKTTEKQKKTQPKNPKQ